MAGYTNVLQALKKADLLGSSGRNLLKSSLAPTVAVHVKYPSGQKVDLGNEIALDQTQAEPQVTFEGLDSSSSSSNTTVLAMLDPDAPSQTDSKWSPYCHWITTCSTTGQPTNPSLMKFFPCGPPENTGLHRYVFMALVKDDDKEIKLPSGVEKDNDKHRPKFGWQEFLDLNGLQVVGVNFHVTKNPKQNANL
ncbi:carboxypeptidase Y inhibitor [Microbotryomycetes sp. JL201]|nr:carboxypeptidase Y inhibitor [Microbotryomycetes sp. JL201]